MRKLYTTLFGLASVLMIHAQSGKTVPQVPASQLKAFPKPTKAMVLPEQEQQEVDTRMTVKPNFVVNQKVTYLEEVIGVTRYDLQSNGSVQNRFAKTGDLLSAGFTMSFQNVDYSDRGTGYNFNDGSEWDEQPTNRLEDVRVGWPSVMHLENGKELIITHDGTEGLRFVSRNVNTDDDWTQGSLPNPTGLPLIWPRAVAGGPDGNSIHLICVTEPIANTGELYEGLDGALVYYRSLDGGTTWDIQAEVLPGLDSTQFIGFDGDAYSIFSRGDKVAFACFNDIKDTFVMISDDNGETWEKTTLVDFPVDLYVMDTGIDLNEDGLGDTIYNSDQSGAVFVDSDMTTHVFFGDMFYLDDVLTDANFSYFPGVNGLTYWREDFGKQEPYTITGTPDLDESGAIELAADGEFIALYYISLSGQPSVGEGDDGTIYLTFAGATETHVSNDDQNYRHTYIIKSEDQGDSWTDPIDLTPDLDEDGFEYVFAAMAPVVDDKVHLIIQRDTEPGLHVRGDEDAADDNDIIYYCITTDLVVEPTVFELFMEGGLAVYPNPATNNVNLTAKTMIGSNIEITNSLGELVYTAKNVTNDRVELNVENWIPGIYTVSAVQNDKVISSKLIVN